MSRRSYYEALTMMARIDSAATFTAGHAARPAAARASLMPMMMMIITTAKKIGTGRTRAT